MVDHYRSCTVRAIHRAYYDYDYDYDGNGNGNDNNNENEDDYNDNIVDNENDVILIRE